MRRGVRVRSLIMSIKRVCWPNWLHFSVLDRSVRAGPKVGNAGF